MTVTLRKFLADDSGAVTTDWIVLTAAIVAVGIAVLAEAAAGLEDLSGDIGSQLTSQSISTVF